MDGKVVVFSIYLSVYVSTYLSNQFINLSTNQPINQSIYQSINQSIYQSINQSTNQSTNQSINLLVYLSICLACLSVYLQAWKRSYSARLPQFSKLLSFKTKQFCETCFKNGKLSAELTALCQCELRFFHSICLKYCACQEKSGQVIWSVAPVTQNHLSKPEDLMLQNAPPLWKSGPGPPNMSDACLLYCTCHAKCIFADPLQMSHACQRFWNCYRPLTFFRLLGRCRIPCAWHAK